MCRWILRVPKILIIAKLTRGKCKTRVSESPCWCRNFARPNLCRVVVLFWDDQNQKRTLEGTCLGSRWTGSLFGAEVLQGDGVDGQVGSCLDACHLSPFTSCQWYVSFSSCLIVCSVPQITCILPACSPQSAGSASLAWFHA